MFTFRFLSAHADVLETPNVSLFIFTLFPWQRAAQPVAISSAVLSVSVTVTVLNLALVRVTRAMFFQRVNMDCSCRRKKMNHLIINYPPDPRSTVRIKTCRTQGSLSEGRHVHSHRPTCLRVTMITVDGYSPPLPP